MTEEAIPLEAVGGPRDGEWIPVKFTQPQVQCAGGHYWIYAVPHPTQPIATSYLRWIPDQ